MPRFYEDVLSPDGNYKAHLTWTEKDGSEVITVSAYPFTPNGERIEGIGKVRRSAHGKEELDIAKSQAAAALFRKLKKKRNKTEKAGDEKKINEASRMVKAFYTLLATSMLNDIWGPSTLEKYMIFFRKNVLPRIQHVETADDFSTDDRILLMEHLKHKSYKNGNSHRNLNNLEDTVHQRMYQAQVIYDAMRIVDSSLPELIFDDNEGRIQRQKKEQVKALPISLHIAIRAECQKILPHSPKLARAIMFMEAGALRTAEAAGANGQDLIDLGPYLAVNVWFQEYKGHRVSLLKSESAYRTVPLDGYASDFIRRANSLIGEESITDAPVTSKELRDAVTAILKNKGIDDKYLVSAKLTYYCYPEYDKDGNPLCDISAYCLRRSRQNIWTNICGLSRAEQDFLLGHRVIKGVKKYYAKEKKDLIKLAEKMDRCKLIFGPVPNLRVLRIEEDGESTQVTVSGPDTIITNMKSGAVKLRISLDCLEAGDIVSICSNGQITSLIDEPSTFVKGERRLTEIF